jgi:deoxyhypusine synthase
LPERVLKYGGVKFRNLVPPVKINRFINKLPQDKKDSLFEIASELSDAGLIEVLNDRAHSTIDQDLVDNMITNSGNFTEDITNFKRH